MQASIWVTTTFVGFHRWKDAPDEVAFLRSWHRHVFHVKVTKQVSHMNRDIEFFLLKRDVDEFVQKKFNGQRFEYSCEQLAQQILEHVEASSVEVSEDKENGAIVEAGAIAVELSATPIGTEDDRQFCWIGTEAEGPCRGECVLFVPGSIGIDKFQAALAQCIDAIDRIYVGAKYDRGASKELLAQVLEEAEQYSIGVDVEVDFDTVSTALEEKAETDFTLILVLDSAEKWKWAFNPNIDYLKWFEADRIVWQSQTDHEVTYVTLLNDPLFLRDQKVC